MKEFFRPGAYVKALEIFTPAGNRKRFLPCTERSLFTIPSELTRLVVMDIKINHSWKGKLSSTTKFVKLR